MRSQGCIYLYTVVSFGGILLNTRTWRNIPDYLKYFVTHGKLFLSNRYISEYEKYSCMFGGVFPNKAAYFCPVCIYVIQYFITICMTDNFELEELYLRQIFLNGKIFLSQVTSELSEYCLYGRIIQI